MLFSGYPFYFHPNKVRNSNKNMFKYIKITFWKEDMILKTSKFGDVEVNEEYIFTFVEPIIGYEQYKEFALIDYNVDSPFKWLQSLDNPDLAMPVTIPAYFGIPYEFTIPDEKEAVLDAKDATEILSLNIANVPNGAPQNTTINLMAPLVINTSNKRAIQLVLSNSNFAIKHRLFEQKES